MCSCTGDKENSNECEKCDNEQNIITNNNNFHVPWKEKLICPVVIVVKRMLKSGLSRHLTKSHAEEIIYIYRPNYTKVCP